MRTTFTDPKKAILLFLCSLLLNVACIREISKYEPDTYKKRFYHRLKQLGWLDEEVSLSALHSDSTMIMLTAGQSNAANSSNAYYTPRHDVLNYYDGHLYKAQEPLVGAGGDGGCVWTILADKLIEKGLYKQVIIVPVAVGSTTIEDWAKGACNAKLKSTLANLKQHGVRLTHVLWHHGESGNGTVATRYKRGLEQVLKTVRASEPLVPFYCAIATYTPIGSQRTVGVDLRLEAVQHQFIAENSTVLEGPNTDQLIGAIHRFDGQHFSAFGNQAYADAWLAALQKQRE